MSFEAAGALASIWNTERTNRANKDMAENATEFNKQEAQRNRDFQERMSSSARQRDVEDLKKAGLNPLLGLSGNGSSTPGGATAQAQTATMEDGVSKGLASAMSAIALKQAIKKQKSETALLDAQTEKSKMETVVASKSLPEAEAKNMIWEQIKSGAKTSTKVLKQIVNDATNAYLPQQP